MKELINLINSLSKGIEVYAVGGFSRDLILKRRHGDIDLAVNKDSAKLAKRIGRALDAKVILLDKESQTYRIIPKNGPVSNIDVAVFLGKNIEQDLNNRDFTVNATAFELKYFDKFRKHLIYANNNCVKDLKTRTINAVNDKSLKNDPLRLLRAFRFSAEAGLSVSPKTCRQIKRNAKFIKKTAPERVKNEFFRILHTNNSAVILECMDKNGLLQEIFPEIIKMKKASKKHYYHPGGLFEHSFETMSAAENILNNLKKFFPDNYKDLEEHFADDDKFSEYVSRRNLLKIAALFHDSAKPETAKREGAKMRFFGHEEEGAKKIEAILKKLKMGKKDISNAMFLVEHHMRPSTLTKNNIVSQKAALKFYRDVGDNTPDLLILSMADWHSYKRLKVFSAKELKQQEKAVRGLIKYYFELKNAKPVPKLINGNIIMKKFKLKPGPWIGELMNYVTEAQQEGKVSDSKQAEKLVSSKLTAVRKKYKI